MNWIELDSDKIDIPYIKDRHSESSMSPYDIPQAFSVTQSASGYLIQIKYRLESSPSQNEIKIFDYCNICESSGFERLKEIFIHADNITEVAKIIDKVKNSYYYRTCKKQLLNYRILEVYKSEFVEAVLCQLDNVTC